MKEKYTILVLVGMLITIMVLMSGCIGNESGQGIEDKNKTNETINEANESSCDNDAGVCKVPTIPEENNKTQNNGQKEWKGQKRPW